MLVSQDHHQTSRVHPAGAVQRAPQRFHQVGRVRPIGRDRGHRDVRLRVGRLWVETPPQPRPRKPTVRRLLRFEPWIEQSARAFGDALGFPQTSK